MPIVVGTPDVQPERVFDRVHVRRFSMQRRTVPPYTISLEIDFELYALGDDGVRVFQPNGRQVLVIDDYEAWFMGLVSGSSPEEQGTLAAFHAAQQAIFAKLITLLSGLDASDVSE